MSYSADYPDPQTPEVVFCVNCQSYFEPTSEQSELHDAPCVACGSAGHSTCQHEDYPPSWFREI